MSPQANTLPAIPLHDGHTVILVSAAAQSADGFNCEKSDDFLAVLTFVLVYRFSRVFCAFEKISPMFEDRV